MKAAIFNPYLDTLGGGERYTLSFAKVLSEELGYDVDIEWKDKTIKDRLMLRFGLKIPGNIKFVNDIKRGEGYDLVFWVSDGSIPTLRARKNYLHFQVPFNNINGKSLLNKMKFFRINKIICNSNFTKKIIDNEYGVDSVVVYPPVDIKNLKPKRKENLILYVGRFSSLKQNKGHEFLINSFKTLIEDEEFKDWRLVLAGGVEVGATNYLKELKKISLGKKIDFFESPDFNTIRDLYGKAKIFWSASGIGIDEKSHPELMEHFGITVVESMASGCVPIVFDGGGHREIIDSGKSGFLWHNREELLDQTRIVLASGTIKNITNNAKIKALKFGFDSFKESVINLLK